MTRRLRVVFAGTPGFSLPSFRALMSMPNVDVVGAVSQPDRPSGRGMKLTSSQIKKAALDASIDVITPERLRGNDEAIAWLRAKSPDVLVVVAFGMILPKSWLLAPRVAAINVHASLLPRWRGAAPIERALLAGDHETGVCIMKMEEGLDTGGIYASHKLPITDSTTGGDLWGALSEMGGDLLVEALPNIASGSLIAVSQPEKGVTYAAKIEAGDRKVAWTQGAAVVDRQVRCFAPKPGARTLYDGKWLKVLTGKPLSTPLLKPAGTVVAINEHIDVSCGDGTYRITRVQPEGKGAMDCADFLRGSHLKTGDRLG